MHHPAGGRPFGPHAAFRGPAQGQLCPGPRGSPVVEGVAQLRTYRNDNERQRLAEAYNDVWVEPASVPRAECSHAWWWGRPAAMKSVLRNVVDRLKDMEASSTATTPRCLANHKFRPPSPDGQPKGGDQLPN